jgi:hypothetical protein
MSTKQATHIFRKPTMRHSGPGSSVGMLCVFSGPGSSVGILCVFSGPGSSVGILCVFSGPGSSVGIAVYYVFLLLYLCYLIIMYSSVCCFHHANWHSSAALTEGFPCFFLSCKANARV